MDFKTFKEKMILFLQLADCALLLAPIILGGTWLLSIAKEAYLAK